MGGLRLRQWRGLSMCRGRMMTMMMIRRIEEGVRTTRVCARV
jgi:hypothetical protein